MDCGSKFIRLQLCSRDNVSFSYTPTIDKNHVGYIISLLENEWKAKRITKELIENVATLGLVILQDESCMLDTDVDLSKDISQTKDTLQRLVSYFETNKEI